MSEAFLRLLIVDDEDSIRIPLKEYLETNHQFQVFTVSDGLSALALLEEKQGQIDVALVDQVLIGQMSGLDLLREIKSRYPLIQIIMFTGWKNEMEKEGVNVLRMGAYRYFKKTADTDELALTIKFAAEEKRVRQEREYLEALVKVGQKLTAANDPHEQLHLAWEFVREQLEVSTFFIGLCSLDGRTISFPLAYDQDREVALEAIDLERDERSQWGVAGYVVTGGEEVLWSNREERERFYRANDITPVVLGEPSDSGFFIPLKMGEKVRGVISAQSYRPYVFTPELRNALRSLASQLSVAQENIRLFGEVNRKAEEASSYATRLGVLQELAPDINSSLDLNTILTNTCRAAAEFFHADHSGLVLFTQDLKEGVVKAEFPALNASGQRIPIQGVPLEEELIASKQPKIILEVEKEEGLGPVREIFLRLGIRSVLLVPVVDRKGRILGSFSLDAIQRQPSFSEEDINLCRMFANHVAVAIENADLYADVKQGREYLSSLFEASSAIIPPCSPREVLQMIVDRAHQTNGAWRASLVLVDETGRPRLQVASGFEQAPEAAAAVAASKITRRVLKTGAPFFFSAHETVERELHAGMVSQGVQAAACLALPLLGRNIGVLWIHFSGAHTFSETEKKALQLYASQAAIAYDNARRIRELEQLQKAAETMARETEWRAVLHQIARSACKVLEADYALIWPYDKSRDLFLPEELVAENVPGHLLEELRQVEPGAGRTTRKVLQEGYIVVQDLGREESQFPPEPTRGFLTRLGVQSFQAIRLEVAGEHLGVLFVDYKSARGFGSEDRRILEHFANQASLTFKKARLYDSVNRSRRAARTVAQVNALGDIEKTRVEIVNGAREVLRCDIATLYEFDEQQKRFLTQEGAGMRDRDNLSDAGRIATTSSLWRVIELGAPYYHAAETAGDPLLQGEFVKKEGVLASMGIQLRFAGERVGVMFINYRTTHRFTKDEIQDALQFANQAAVAIHNAHLHAKIERRAEVLDGLYKAGQAITSTLAIEDTLQRISEQALAIVNKGGRQEGYYSYLILRVRDQLRFEAASDPELLPRLKDEIHLNLNSSPKIGIAGRCILSGRPQNVPDVNLDEDYIPVIPGTLSQLSVPIRIGDETIGAITIEAPVRDAFQPEDERNLGLLAPQSAVAIKNAQVYGETAQKLAARSALAWTGMLGSTWLHAVEKHTITIREQIQLLRMDLENIPQPLQQRLDMIERLANQILDKPITPPLSQEEGVNSLDPDQFIRERTRQLWVHEPYHSARLELDLELGGRFTVRASPEWLRRALDILIDNAIEAGAAQPAICISTRCVGGRAEIAIQDNGRGIPPGVLERLFKKPIEKSAGAKGQGIGLLLAQMIVQTYDGTLTCRETGPSGTRMVISLPVE